MIITVILFSGIFAFIFIGISRYRLQKIPGRGCGRFRGSRKRNSIRSHRSQRHGVLGMDYNADGICRSRNELWYLRRTQLRMGQCRTILYSDPDGYAFTKENAKVHNLYRIYRTAIQ